MEEDNIKQRARKLIIDKYPYLPFEQWGYFEDMFINGWKQALTMPVVMWRFCAYKTEKDYESGDHYFMKYFLDHTEMKNFSAEHSAKEKPQHTDYCSMYWKIETNAL